jgi:hypothetical protein
LLDQVGTAARQCALTLAVAFLFLGGGQAHAVTLPQLTHGPPVAPVRQGGELTPPKTRTVTVWRDVYGRSLRWNVHPQKHEQKDEDRIDNDPHDIRGPTTLPLLYSPLAHDGSLSLGPENVSPARSACNRAHGRSLGKT